MRFRIDQARSADLLHRGALITSSVDFCGQRMTGPVRLGMSSLDRAR